MWSTNKVVAVAVLLCCCVVVSWLGLYPLFESLSYHLFIFSDEIELGVKSLLLCFFHHQWRINNRIK